MMIEVFKNKNSSIKEIQENSQKPLKRKHNQTGEGIEQKDAECKNGNRNNKEITKGDNPVDRKSRKEIRSHRHKHH